jgi:hypothetical protein
VLLNHHFHPFEVRSVYPPTTIRKVGKALFCQFDTDEIDIFPYFNKAVPFLNSMCDYTIFYPYKNTMFVFLCVLKTESVNNSSRQVESAKLFAEFIIHKAERTLNFKKFRIEYRALIFSTSDKRRFSTNIKKDAYSQHPYRQPPPPRVN